MLLFTLGDPHSVNVELARGWLGGGDLRAVLAAAQPVVVVGGKAHWRDQERRLGLPELAFVDVPTLAAARPGLLSFLDVGAGQAFVPAEQLDPRARGQLAVAALEALRAAPKGRPLAVVTGPIDKHACHEAGYPFAGQTEFFEALWQAPAVMTLAGPRLRVGLVTNHLPLAAVARAIDGRLVEQKLALFVETLRASFGLSAPRIAVCGLNPHASDQGLFGDEEARVIAPAVARVRERGGAVIEGPLPADTVFYRCLHGVYDGVLAMYHDQGLGPLKTVHFDEAVNLSGGLPHLRVSPDHGPAADLFLARRASPRSFQAAFEVAANFLLSRGPA
jgi:4-hydroxythreonine-4-phosphate dehydrogenase